MFKPVLEKAEEPEIKMGNESYVVVGEPKGMGLGFLVVVVNEV